MQRIFFPRVIAFFFPFLLLVSSIPAQSKEYADGQVIVKFKTGTTAQQENEIKVKLKAKILKRFKAIRAELWEIGEGKVDAVIEEYGKNPRIEYIEPNYKVFADDFIPNDSRFSELWGMHNTGQTGGTADADIDAPEAWGVHLGGAILIGVIDTGVDYNHPELTANIWTNPGEIPANGLDDDANGYVDDVRGWDWVNDDNNPMDDNGHGTHCSGTVAATGNNGIGVIGVNPLAKILPLKFLDSSGSGYNSDAVLAIEYATGMGARLTSNSWGGGGYSQSMIDAIQAAGDAGQLFIAAAGNAGTDNDVYPHYPSSYELDNIIAVANTNHNDQMSSSSCWGLRSVDLGAPGSSILSTVPGNAYAVYSGTSMATPHVAGAVGLLWSMTPGLTHLEAKELICGTVDIIPALTGKTVTGGRLNVYRALMGYWNVPPPDISVDPASFTEGLETGQMVTRPLTVSNTGLSDLIFTLPEFSSAALAQSSGIQKNPGTWNIPRVELQKGETDARQGNPVVLGGGGPDLFGYAWIDSDEPGGPVYQWFDIAGIGTNLGLIGDDNYAPLSLPFSFPYYGSSYTQVYVSTNGILTFGSGTADYSNDPIPYTGTPNLFIAPFWDDLHQRTGSVFYYHDATNHRLIIQYSDWGRYSDTTSRYTFQVQFAEDGAMAFFYRSMAGVLNNATVGIENSGGTDGLQMVFNQSYVHDSLAVCISEQPGFLSVSPASGTVAPGSSAVLDVTFDATSLSAGRYNDMIRISSNDPDETVVSVPAVLDVFSGPPPEISTEPDSFDVTLPPDTSRIRSLTLSNNGGSPLTYSITLDLEMVPLGDFTIVDPVSRPGGEPVGPETQRTQAPPDAIGQAVGLPFYDGFEDGNFDGWTVDSGSGTREATSLTAARGAFSFHYNSGPNSGHMHGVHQEFNSGSQPPYISFFIRSGSTVQSDGYAVFLSTGGYEVIWFFARGDGLFYVNWDVGGNHSVAYQALAWYRIEFKEIDWINKHFDYYVNGVLIQSAIPFRNATVVNDVASLFLYNFESQSQAWWDEIYVGPEQSWLSMPRIAGSVPAGSSDVLDVRFDSGGLAGGDTWTGDIVISSNDPVDRRIQVPATLRIRAAEMTVLAPDGGEIWQGGSQQRITWSSYGTKGRVKIEYSADNGTAWSTVVFSTPDDGSFTWNVPRSPSANCLVRISDTDGSPADTSNGLFTITGRPDTAVTDLRASAAGANVLLEWSGLADATGYQVYRDTTYAFTPDTAGGANRIASDIRDEDPSMPGVQWTDTGNGEVLLGDPNVHHFWRVSGLLSGGESDASNVAGEYEFSLVTTAGTDINEVVVGMDTRRTRNPLATAEDLANAIPNCTVVYVWDAARQGSVGHPKGLPFNNFTVHAGFPYSVNVTANTVWTVTGSCPDTAYTLITTAGTDINHLGLPFCESHNIDAESLGRDIPYASVVYRWEAALQGSIGHPIGLPFNNFAVAAFRPYWVNVTGNSVWPLQGTDARRKGTLATETQELAKPAVVHVLRGGVPHLVYGKYRYADGLKKLTPAPVQLRIWITARPAEVLTEMDVGTGTDSTYWWGNVGNLPTAWSIGEDACIVLSDTVNKVQGKGRIRLSGDGADAVDEILLEKPAQVDGIEDEIQDLPREALLVGNYPNPFNPVTTIVYRLPSRQAVTIELFDVRGQQVKVLFAGMQEAGQHRLEWDATDRNGRKVMSGVYLCTMTAPAYRNTRKILLIR